MLDMPNGLGHANSQTETPHGVGCNLGCQNVGLRFKQLAQCLSHSRLLLRKSNVAFAEQKTTMVMLFWLKLNDKLVQIKRSKKHVDPNLLIAHLYPSPEPTLRLSQRESDNGFSLGAGTMLGRYLINRRKHCGSVCFYGVEQRRVLRLRQTNTRQELCRRSAELKRPQTRPRNLQG